MLVGFSRSGKSVLADEIMKHFPRLTKIDSDTIHSFLNNTYSVFDDDATIGGKSYDLRQKTTEAIRKALASILITNSYFSIVDYF